MTTWLELCRAERGDRVRFVQTWDIFDTGVIPIGTTGIIVENCLNEITNDELFIRPDNADLQALLNEWGGFVILGPLFPDDELSHEAPVELIRGPAPRAADDFEAIRANIERLRR